MNPVPGNHLEDHPGLAPDKTPRTLPNPEGLPGDHQGGHLEDLPEDHLEDHLEDLHVDPLEEHPEEDLVKTMVMLPGL